MRVVREDAVRRRSMRNRGFFNPVRRTGVGQAVRPLCLVAIGSCPSDPKRRRSCRTTLVTKQELAHAGA
jgi:hypothetical protein